MDNKRYITTNECTRIFGLSREWISKLCIGKKIDAYKNVKGRWIINYDSLRTYLDNTPKAKRGNIGNIYVKQRSKLHYLQDSLDIFLLRDPDFDYINATDKEGRVFNLSTREEYTQTPDEEGYLCVSLLYNHKWKQFCVHQLVAQSQIDNHLLKSEVHHIDENPLNNNVKNLIWVTRTEHGELHRLLNANQVEEYEKRIKEIRADNCQKLFKTKHPDMETDEHVDYYMYLTKKGYDAFKEGNQIPIDSIVLEYADYKNGSESI